MDERAFRDNDRFIERYDRSRPNPASWIIPVLLLPIAFLGGWAANGYVNSGQVENVPGIETGVGGGPDRREIISPLPTNITAPTSTPTTTPTPIEEMDLTPTPVE